MKLGDYTSRRLDDVVAEMSEAARGDPFARTPFGPGKEGTVTSGWAVSLRRAAMLMAGPGRYLFSKDDMILITVPATGSGVQPDAADMPFGWDGKINEYTAECAVWWAFGIASDAEAAAFMREHRPAVIFSYVDGRGPGEIAVRFNGEFWEVTG